MERYTEKNVTSEKKSKLEVTRSSCSRLLNNICEVYFAWPKMRKAMSVSGHEEGQIYLLTIFTL